jgi:hypothetical protein
MEDEVSAQAASDETDIRAQLSSPAEGRGCLAMPLGWFNDNTDKKCGIMTM